MKKNKNKNNFISNFEISLVIFFFASIFLIFWHNLGMNKEFILNSESNPAPISWNDDINDGQSIGKLTPLDGGYQLDCQLINSENTFSFCGLMLPIVDKAQSQGIDLSTYDTLDIDVALISDQKDTIIISLLNKDDKKSNSETRRVNSTSIYPNKNIRHFSLLLKTFSIPSWWLFNNPNTEKGVRKTDISNVTSIQISSGDNRIERNETIIIKNIAFKGKWLSKEDLYLSLLCCWLMILFSYFAFRLVNLNKRLQSSKQTEKELLSLNSLLSIEKDKFETMAKIDPLTQVYNRAGIRSILDTAIEKLSYHKTPCSLILLDIDHFKQINDTYGHPVGDDVLVSLVNFIIKNTRKEDHLVRWGGEEFMLVCTNTTVDIAMVLAEKLRTGISRTELGNQSITCSFGVGSLNSKDLQGCFKAIDVALYKAKSAGRNIIIKVDKK